MAVRQTYDDRFFDYIAIGSKRSAAVVAPLVLQHYPASSVLDIGCGRGVWLGEWRRAGVDDYFGIDGDYIDRKKLMIVPERFRAQDLTAPFYLKRKFDLAISLEVAEHIAPEATKTFIDNLCLHADAILFSAAVPGQGGLGHVNEQPYEFWRSRFCARGYRLFDFLRPKLVSDRAIEPWYRYNCLFFARGGAVKRLSEEARAAEIHANASVPDYSTANWRLRAAIIRRLPAAACQRLMGAKHNYVRWRYALRSLMITR